ncbi:hypothetical protein PAXRUDRAFT_166703 [Paxillus rubicundulus Ve08.2h10]|uniref:Unplaced genomic scaffold scaffold_2146, whole genome shotgun sequence n=1 Tax=Paxillus rubicundulus Ve08.2h10 TaxID=930991 RepID=A0A0D0DHI6_9AGAM|nr:hypothetical protein PAXRUDRAFT_166703 [Paxillus rubicundulus Ve08.2h10]
MTNAHDEFRDLEDSGVYSVPTTTIYRLNPSKNSQTSSHCLHSQGQVGLETLNGTGKKTRKPCAKWTTEEKNSFMEFLLSQCLSSGNGSNFKKHTFTVAAMHLKVKFPNTSGAEKMCDVCQGKWTAVSHFVEVDISSIRMIKV